MKWESLIFGDWLGGAWYEDGGDSENRAFAIWIVCLQTFFAGMLLGFWYPEGTLVGEIALFCGWTWLLGGWGVFSIVASVLYIDRFLGIIDFISSMRK